MANDPVERLKQRMASQEVSQTEKQGSVSGEREGETLGDKPGSKTQPEKAELADALTADAMAKDLEDTREETSGDERHDLLIPKELNIPPTIVQERLRMGQNPATGEPWSRNERMEYDKLQEQARQDHARAVRESEERMRSEREASQTPIQPTPHVPTSFLTPGQRKAMQEAQDRGEGPIAQAAARDQNHPDEIGRRSIVDQPKTRHEKERENLGIDAETEAQALAEQEADENENDRPKDATEQIEELERKSKR